MKTLLVMIAMLVAVPSFANPALGPGSQSVKQANDKITTLLKQKAAAAKVTDSVRDFLDLDELGKRAMVNQWTKLSKEEQKHFLDTLRALIEENYVRVMKSNLTYTVDYTGESSDANGNITVTTVVNSKTSHGRDVKIKVDYVLKKDGNKLKAWDVMTDGVGLVDNYRTQFDKIIDRDGFKGIIDKMNKKLDELKKSPDKPADK